MEEWRILVLSHSLFPHTEAKAHLQKEVTEVARSIESAIDAAETRF